MADADEEVEQTALARGAQRAHSEILSESLLAPRPLWALRYGACVYAHTRHVSSTPGRGYLS